MSPERYEMIQIKINVNNHFSTVLTLQTLKENMGAQKHLKSELCFIKENN